MAKKVSVFKKVYSWLHLWLGLVVGLIFATVALTGSLLIFEDELEEWIYHDFYFAKEIAAQPLPLDCLVAKVRLLPEGASADRLIIYQKGRPVNYIFIAGKEKKDRQLIAVNPYSGRLVARVQDEQRFFRVVENLHRFLLLDKTGKTITGICCLAYIVILLSGLLLWWPNNKKVLKQRLKIKWDASAKRVNWDFHAVTGFYSMPVVLVICLTGLVWSYKVVNNSIYYAFDGKLPKQESERKKGAKKDAVSFTGSMQAALTTSRLHFQYPGDLNLQLQPALPGSLTITNTRPGGLPNRVDELQVNSLGRII